jgi:hypothetical protein
VDDLDKVLFTFAAYKGIPLVKIASRLEVSVNLKGTRVSGPSLVLK